MYLEHKKSMIFNHVLTLSYLNCRVSSLMQTAQHQGCTTNISPYLEMLLDRNNRMIIAPHTERHYFQLL